jgi:outer membrane protein assembly factor BamB
MRLQRVPFMGCLLTVALLSSLSPLVLASTTALAASDQAVAYQNDPAHTGGQTGDALRPLLQKKWSLDLHAGTISYPLIAGGLVYVLAENTIATTGTRLFALDQSSGRAVWSASPGGSWADAAFDNGNVFTMNDHGLMSSFNGQTGALNWSMSLADSNTVLFNSPPTAANGIVYTAGSGYGGTVFALSESDGHVIWSRPVQEGQDSAPAVSTTGVYVSYPGEVYDFAPATGTLIWQYSHGYGGGGTTPVLFNDRLYYRDWFGNGAGIIFDAGTGAQLGTFTSATPPVFDDSFAFFMSPGPSYGRTLEERNLSDNVLRWSFAGDGELVAPPVAVNGYVYTGSISGSLWALDENSGRVVWSDNVGSSISAGMAIGNSLLVVPAGNGVTVYTSSGTPPPPPSSTTYWSAMSTQQYRLSQSDGAAFTSIDATMLKITLTPTASATAVLTGNADLWTATSGYNQDLGIAADVGGTLDKLVAWKESGGYGGTYSPNATAVQATYQLGAGTPITFRLVWKTNKRQTTGASIYAGAGPLNGTFSPTSLSVRILPSGSVNDLRSTQQYRLGASDGVHWLHLDSGSSVPVTPATASVARLGGNADLWTETAGVNQDLAILVTVDSGPEQLVAWKESGGAAGTYSPNAAFIQATYPVLPGHIYDFWLAWKTNRPFSGPGAIHAGAGPIINGQYSPTSLIAQVLPTAVSNASSAKQYSLPGSNGADWVPLDATSFTVSLPVGTTTASAVLGANADLWADTAGINQDLAIFVSVNGAPEQLVAWKESGGFAGTYSPNAAFVRADYRLEPGVTYTFTLKWKSNRLAPSSAGIHAGAGPLGTQYSPTSLIADIAS